MTMSTEILKEEDMQEEEGIIESEDEDIDVGSNESYRYKHLMANHNVQLDLIDLFPSDGETDMERISEDAAAMKKVGVRSFGIDDILGHTSARAKEAGEQREGRPGQGRSPLDALFTMTTNFESMKQKSGEKQRGSLSNEMLRYIKVFQTGTICVSLFI